MQLYCAVVCTENTLCSSFSICRSSGGRTLPLGSLTALHPSRPCYSFPTLCAVWQSLALPAGKNRISHMSLCVMCVSVSPSLNTLRCWVSWGKRATSSWFQLSFLKKKQHLNAWFAETRVFLPTLSTTCVSGGTEPGSQTHLLRLTGAPRGSQDTLLRSISFKPPLLLV